MPDSLLPKLAPRLRDLAKGGYARTYRLADQMFETSTHQLVSELLASLGIAHLRDVKIKGASGLVADFVVGRRAIFVQRSLAEAEIAEARGSGYTVLIISRHRERSDGLDHGIRVLGLGERGDLQTIFMDDPSFNFDYAHVLPKTQKCSVMHGHTSAALVEIVGRPVDGMVVDFGIAKEIIRDAVRSLDHKLFINEKYVTRMDSKSVTLSFETVHGEFAIKAPKATTVLLSGEATVENLAREVLARIAPKMPENVTAVGVYVYEGLNKGSHLIAQIHQTGVENPRKKR